MAYNLGLTIVGIESYTIPTYGNKHSMPYGKLRVTDGKVTKVCVIKEENYMQYITWNRRRYYVKNAGSLYSPKFEFNGVVC